MDELVTLALMVLLIVMWIRVDRASSAIERLTEQLDLLKRHVARSPAEQVGAADETSRQAAAAPQTHAQVVMPQAPPATPPQAPPTPRPPAIGRTSTPEPVQAPHGPAASGDEPAGSPSLPVGHATASGSGAESASAAPGAPPPSIPSDTSPGFVDRVKDWLFGGNTVVRVGVIVLFVGVGFFLNYAMDQGWLPVEIRLISAAIGGLALVGTGWRLRERRHDYALVLQGGGVGIVYLTVFAAMNLTSLIGSGPGLALMVVLVVLSSALAVLQDARSLAILATLGGFLAPVLSPTSGNHVALFSYFLALDVGVLAIAWFKAWRILNLLGFIGTFIVSAAWGAQYYQPEYFASTEPFLVAFFLFYVAVPVLHARQPQGTRTRHLDGTLLFGMPLVAFGLQSALVRDFEYGMAFSALAAGIFYVALASVLWKLARRRPHARRGVRGARGRVWHARDSARC